MEYKQQFFPKFGNYEPKILTALTYEQMGNKSRISGSTKTDAPNFGIWVIGDIDNPASFDYQETLTQADDLDMSANIYDVTKSVKDNPLFHESSSRESLAIQSDPYLENNITVDAENKKLQTVTKTAMHQDSDSISKINIVQKHQNPKRPYMGRLAVLKNKYIARNQLYKRIEPSINSQTSADDNTDADEKTVNRKPPTLSIQRKYKSSIDLSVRLIDDDQTDDETGQKGSLFDGEIRRSGSLESVKKEAKTAGQKERLATIKPTLFKLNVKNKCPEESYEVFNSRLSEANSLQIVNDRCSNVNYIVDDRNGVACGKYDDNSQKQRGYEYVEQGKESTLWAKLKRRFPNRKGLSAKTIARKDTYTPLSI